MRIGIILTGDNSWAGGLYYSLNIIKLLSSLSHTHNLHILVFINSNTSSDILKEIAHEHVTCVNLDAKSLLYKVRCKLMGWISQSNYRFVNDINSEKLDVLYPLIRYEKGFENIRCRVIYWMYDFQHKFLPQLFSTKELLDRDRQFEELTQKAKTLVLSSYNSKDHLLQFYPNCRSSLFVYNFVSLIKKSDNSIKTTLPEKYFVVCNQFWPHKNHLIVLKALRALVLKKVPIYIVFTGKIDDVRNQAYVADLTAFIKENQLQQHVLFTGFIDRAEQINIISSSMAVIQPSLFEGWSTVIEDAKALNKSLLVSNIAIHREQIKQHVFFFDPADELSLSNQLEVMMQSRTHNQNNNYQEAIQKSKDDLLNLFQITSPNRNTSHS